MTRLKKINSKQIFLTLSAVLLAAVIIVLARSWAFSDMEWTVDKGEKVNITGSGITETFSTSRDGLSEMSILFGSSRLRGGGTLHLSVLDASCKTELRASDIHASGLSSDNTVEFPFASIADSNGKTYCLHLSYEPDPGTGGVATVFITDAVGAALGTQLSLDDIPRASMSLSMRPSYRNASIFGDLRELTERISQYKPWFLKDALIATIALVSIVLSLGIVVIAILV